jgi:Leucine-rich repeat (LRR) protein
MTSLSELDLSFNQIYQLPHSITGLTRVTALRLSFNELKASPLTLFHLHGSMALILEVSRCMDGLRKFLFINDTKSTLLFCH